LWVLPPLGVPTLLQEFSPLRVPVWCSVDESHPHSGTQILTYELPSFDPQADDSWQFFFVSANFVARISPHGDQDRHSVDGLYLHSESMHPICRWFTPHFRSISSSQLHLWDVFPLGAIVIQLCCWDFPYSEVRIGILLMGSTPTWSRHIQFVDGSHTSTSKSYQVCRYHWWDYSHLEISQACQNTPNQPFLLEIQIKHSGKVWSFRYYPNINRFYSNNVIAYACMYWLFRINMDHVYLAYSRTRHMVYTWGFSCLDYSLDVLVSCD